MKKHIAIVITLFLAAAVFAQQPAPQSRQRTPPEQVSVSGVLVLSEGRIAVQSGGTLYYTPSLMRLVGFIEGLKESASVKVEGYDRASGDARHILWVTKLELGGKSYDLGTGKGGFGQAFNRQIFKGPGSGPAGQSPGFAPNCGCGFGRRGAGRGRNR